MLLSLLVVSLLLGVVVGVAGGFWSLRVDIWCNGSLGGGGDVCLFFLRSDSR